MIYGLWNVQYLSVPRTKGRARTWRQCTSGKKHRKHNEENHTGPKRGWLLESQSRLKAKAGGQEAQSRAENREKEVTVLGAVGGGEIRGETRRATGETESQWCAASVFSFLDIFQVFMLASKSARTKITLNFWSCCSIPEMLEWRVCVTPMVHETLGVTHATQALYSPQVQFVLCWDYRYVCVVTSSSVFISCFPCVCGRDLKLGPRLDNTFPLKDLSRPLNYVF